MNPGETHTLSQRAEIMMRELVPPNDNDVSANNPAARRTDEESKYFHELKQSTGLCWVCGNHLKSVKSLRVHLQTHSKDCCKGGKQSEGTDSDEMKEGARSEEEKTNVGTLDKLCWICGECLNSTKSLRLHLQTQHKDSFMDWEESGGAYSDGDSDKDETQAKFHPTDFLCWVCGTFLSSAETLMVHLQMHNEEK